jgi:hypothetical protein
MLWKKCLIICLLLLPAMDGFSQTSPADTIPTSGMESLAVDTSLDYDEMMDELGDFLDSLLSPRSYFLINATASSGYFNYKNSTVDRIDSRKKFIFSPLVGVYHKSGPGLTLSGNATNQEQGFVLYQYLVSPSFDFIQSRKWIGGVSYTRYFNRDSAEFYVTPLQNELNAYFTWRKSWLQPGISLAYGWGSSEDVQKEKELIQLLQKRGKKRNLPITVITETNTKESIADFSVNASLRHSFYWLDLSKHNDYIRFTPMVVFSAGTQKFGFNQTSTSFASTALKTGRIEYNRGNHNLDNNTKFQPLSLTLYLRPEYSIGKFFIQPQLLLDYYFPSTENNFTVIGSISAGFMF